MINRIYRKLKQIFIMLSICTTLLAGPAAGHEVSKMLESMDGKKAAQIQELKEVENEGSDGEIKISATATVKSVQNFVKLSEDEIVKVLADHQGKLNLSKKQQERWYKKCICLVEFENVSEIQPLDFDHQGNMDDWLIVDKIEDVVVGTSIPYNYEKSKF